MVQSSCSGSSFSPPSTQTGYASEQKSGWGESDANVRSLSESSCVLRSLWWGPQASFSSSGVPWTLSSAFPVSSHRSGAVARSYLFFRFFWHFLFFISFVFPPFVVSFLHDPYFTHSSIKMCVCVCVGGGGGGIIWIPEAWRLWSVSLLRVRPNSFLSCHRVSVQLRSVSTNSDLTSSSSSLRFFKAHH